MIAIMAGPGRPDPSSGQVIVTQTERPRQGSPRSARPARARARSSRAGRLGQDPLAGAVPLRSAAVEAALRLQVVPTPRARRVERVALAVVVGFAGRQGIDPAGDAGE